MVPNCEMNNRD